MLSNGNVLWTCIPTCTTHILSCSIIVVIKALLLMLLDEGCMREVYLFTHVDGTSQWPLLGCWLLPVKSATVQCSCFALLCNPHNAVLCTPACWVRLA